MAHADSVENPDFRLLGRFTDAFVDQMNLAEAGFGRVTQEVRGRLGYDPADLLKLYIYGYLNCVRSSLRLQVECRRNSELIWLLRRFANDVKTIADWRRNNR
ncbi:MAG: transposase [Sedimentitalea sp.]